MDKEQLKLIVIKSDLPKDVEVSILQEVETDGPTPQVIQKLIDIFEDRNATEKEELEDIKDLYHAIEPDVTSIIATNDASAQEVEAIVADGDKQLDEIEEEEKALDKGIQQLDNRSAQGEK